MAPEGGEPARSCAPATHNRVLVHTRVHVPAVCGIVPPLWSKPVFCACACTYERTRACVFSVMPLVPFQRTAVGSSVRGAVCPVPLRTLRTCVPAFQRLRVREATREETTPCRAAHRYQFRLVPPRRGTSPHLHTIRYERATRQAGSAQN